MTHIPFTVSQDIVTGDTLVEWRGGQLGDTFDVVPCRGYRLQALQQSAAGDQQACFEASLQAVATDAVNISQLMQGAYISEDATRNRYYAWIRPKIVSGTPAPQNFAALFRRMV